MRAVQLTHLGLRPASASSWNTKYAISAFAFAFICAQKVKIGGDIYLGEIFGLIFFLMSIGKKQFRSTLTLTILAFVWAAVQLFSDLINSTPVGDSLKGVLAPVVLICTILGFARYFNADLRRVPYFIAGAATGQLASQLIEPTAIFLSNPWKWGVGSFVLTVFSVYYSWMNRAKGKYALWLFALVFFVVCTVLNSRSLAAFPIAALLLARFISRSGSIRIFRTKYKTSILLALMIIVLGGLNFGLTYVFSADWFLKSLPTEVAEKYRAQAAGEYGVFIGGRPEILVSSIAIADSPLIGHGSWAIDKAGYLSTYAQLRYQLGYVDNEEVEDLGLDLIPVHSYLFGAMVWAGVLGGVFWIYVIHWLITCFFKYKVNLEFYFYVGGITLIWNILFSPFGASHRWATAVYLAAISAAVINLRTLGIRK